MHHFYQTEADTTLQNVIPRSLHEDANYGFVMSRHAKQRMIERDLHKKALELVLIFGESVHTHGGCVKIIVNKSISLELLAEGYDVQLLEKALRLEVIQSSNSRIVTAYRRPAPRLNRLSVVSTSFQKKACHGARQGAQALH